MAKQTFEQLLEHCLQDAVRTGDSPPPYEKLLELLTDAQRRQLTAMQGDPFTFPKPHFILLRPGGNKQLAACCLVKFRPDATPSDSLEQPRCAQRGNVSRVLR